MPYDETKDPAARRGPPGSLDFGRSGQVVSPHDANDLVLCTRVVVTSAGDLTVLPAKNADGSTITFVDCPVGFVPPYRVRRVLDTGTTAAVATVDE